MKNSSRTPLFGSETRRGRPEGDTSAEDTPRVLNHIAGAAVVFLAAGAASLAQHVIRNQRRDAR